MHKFWDDHMNQLVMVGLVGGKHPIPAVNVLYRARTAEIIRRYGKAYRIELSTGSNPHEAYAIAGSDLKDGTPILRIFMPSVMNIYDELVSRDSAPAMDFESTVTVMIFHELDHISLGRIGHPGQTKEEFFATEAATWAETCDNIISILVGLHFPVDASDYAYYRVWNTCGKQMNACWTSFISQAYTQISKDLL